MSSFWSSDSMSLSLLFMSSPKRRKRGKVREEGSRGSREQFGAAAIKGVGGQRL